MGLGAFAGLVAGIIVGAVLGASFLGWVAIILLSPLVGMVLLGMYS